jgi:hypothetical protein
MDRMGFAMNAREPGLHASRRGWVAVGLGAVAVIGLVVGVWVATHGSTDTVSGGSTSLSATATGPTAAAPNGTGPASAVALFPDDDDELFADTTREVAVDEAGAWPTGACPALAAEKGRVDFVSGTEEGPEYSRDLAMGWYADDTSAHDAYDSVWATIQACAASAGATVASAPAGLGVESLSATVAGPLTDGEADVSIYVVARIDGVLTMAVDHASFLDGSIPAPADATGTHEQAERLIAELCRVEADRC